MAKDKKNDFPVEDAVEEYVNQQVIGVKKVDVDAFIARRLKVINGWPDGAKKRAAAERLFRNKEAKR